MQRLLLVAVKLTFATAMLADDGTQDFPKGDLSLLKSWKTRSYTYNGISPGNNEVSNFGTITLKTIVKNDAILLDDQMKLTYRGKQLSLHLKHTCRRDRFLSPLRIESEGSGDDEVGTFVVTVDGTTASVKGKRKDRKFNLPRDTVTSWAFMRLVTLLPRDEGSVARFSHWMESEELHQKKDFKVESLGSDAIMRGERQIPCTKFRLTSDVTMPALYWVDDSGVLQRMLIDRRKSIDLVEQPSNPKPSDASN